MREHIISTVLAKLFVPVDWLELHGTRSLRCEDILGRPVDQLGTQATDTPDTKVVMGGLDLGAIVGR